LAFRQFLTEIDSKKLASFATYCLENAFTDSGQVLQDLVNEIGRRLGLTPKMVGIEASEMTSATTVSGLRTDKAWS